MKNPRGILAVFGTLVAVVLVGLRIYFDSRKASVPVPPQPGLKNRFGSAEPLADTIRKLRASDPVVREKAARAIQREASQPLRELRPVGKDSLPDLLKAAGDGNLEVRQAATLCLARIGPEAVTLLLEALRRQDRETARVAAALFALGPAGRAGLLTWTIQRQLLQVDYAVALGTALADTGGDVLPRLRQGLGDASRSARMGCAFALLKLGPKAVAAVEDLGVALKDADENVAIAAAMALGMIGKPAVPTLTAALKEGTDGVRANACFGLLRVGQDAERAARTREVGNLVERRALERRWQQARTEAKKEAVPALHKALEDSSPQVRLYAAAALLDFPAEFPAIRLVVRPYLTAKDPVLRQQARSIQHALDRHPEAADP
jgi:HEAT repeat protein